MTTTFSDVELSDSLFCECMHEFRALIIIIILLYILIIIPGNNNNNNNNEQYGGPVLQFRSPLNWTSVTPANYVFSPQDLYYQG